jgi:hypothetical protein
MRDTCACGNETSVAIHRGEYFDYLRNNELLKKDSAPLSKVLYPCRRHWAHSKVWVLNPLVLNLNRCVFKLKPQ